jgi:hypothetical protein
LFAFFRIKPALAKVIRTTADDIVVARQEKSVGCATADFDDVLIKYIKSINSCWNTSALDLLVTKLPEVIPTP